jgi:hypothetical protein
MVVSRYEAEKGGSLRGMLTIDDGVEDVFAISIDQIVDVAKDSTVSDRIRNVYNMAVSF